MAPAPDPRGPNADDENDPFHLRVVDLGARVLLGYFAVIALALFVSIARADRATFRSWTSFALQAAGAFLVATIVARRTLTGWQQAGSRFVPANIASASVAIGAALGVGTLAGGFFPDALNYQRRAPEMFFRSVAAMVPAAIAVYVVLRSAAGSRSPAVSQPAAGIRQGSAPEPAPSLTGEARDAALGALDLLDRGEDALTRFRERLASGSAVTSGDADRMWAALDGPGYVALLRQLPPEHTVRHALLAASVAQTDAAYLIALARGAHDAMGHTAESAAEFVEEVAARRGVPGANAATLAEVARTEAKVHRDIAAGQLHASRFGGV